MPQPSRGESSSTDSGAAGRSVPARKTTARKAPAKRASSSRSAASKTGASRSTSRSSASKSPAKRASSSRATAKSTRSTSAKSSRSTAARSTRSASSRSTGARRGTASSDARLEAVANRVRKLNERIIEAGREAGETTLTSYEKALKAIATGIEKGPGRSDIDWIAHLATSQAKFIRELTDSWASAARGVLKP